jgi:hypothetical protein
MRHEYRNTFSGLVVIKLFLEMLIFQKCQNLRKLQGREKYKNWRKPRSFLLQASSPLESKYPIIYNISLSYDFGGTSCFSSFAKISNKNCHKRSHSVKDSKYRKLPKKLHMFIAEIS